MSNKNMVMVWLQRFLKPYLQERLKMLVAAEGADAAGMLAASEHSNKLAKAMPLKDPFKANSLSISSSASTRPSGVGRSISSGMGGVLITAPSPNAIATAASLVGGAKRSRAGTSKHLPGHHHGGAAVRTPAPVPFSATGPAIHARSSQSGGGGNGRSSASSSSSSSSSSSDSASSSSSSSGAAPPATRFKRCYYVPVMNPLPDLKDKQLAVLEMRLYGIRDMPTLREPAPMLPQSVIGTAKLRDLPLFRLKDMVDVLDAAAASPSSSIEEQQAKYEREQMMMVMAQQQGEEEVEEEVLEEEEEHVAATMVDGTK